MEQPTLCEGKTLATDYGVHGMRQAFNSAVVNPQMTFYSECTNSSLQM